MISDSPVFIVGCPRSGTRLLRDLLRSHPHLTFPGESFFIPLFYKAYGDPQTEREALKLAEKILKLPWVRLWAKGLDLTPSSFAGDRSYKDIVSRLFEAWAAKENKSRWGEKTPYYITEMPILLEIFPACKIIHIYRDGRDVALSWSRFQPNAKNIFTGAHLWKYFVETGRRTGKTLSFKNYLEIRYETLLAEPVQTMKEVCFFLNEPFSEAVLTPSPFAEPDDLALIGSWKRKDIKTSKIVPSNALKWKREMSKKNRVLFESIAGDLLASLNYETEGGVRKISKSEEVLLRAHQFIWYLFQRLNQRDFFSSLSGSREMIKAQIRARYKPAAAGNPSCVSV